MAVDVFNAFLHIEEVDRCGIDLFKNSSVLSRDGADNHGNQCLKLKKHRCFKWERGHGGSRVMFPTTMALFHHRSALTYAGNLVRLNVLVHFVILKNFETFPAISGVF